MVACDWQRLIVGCVPQVAVFHPVARYRPKAWKLLAVTLNIVVFKVLLKPTADTAAVTQAVFFYLKFTFQKEMGHIPTPSKSRICGKGDTPK